LNGAKIEGEFPDLAGKLEARSPDGKLSARANGSGIEVRDEVLWSVLNGEMNRRLAAWAKPNPAWHTARAADAEKAGDHFAVAFHLGRLLLDDPDNATLKKRREDALKKHEEARP
jgi:hypothetical protein